MRIVIFDTETTGLPRYGASLQNQPYVCQFASLTLEYDGETFTEVGSIDQLIKPPISIPAEVVAIHGVDDAAVADKPSFADIADTIMNVFDDADAAAAHNLSFDRDLLSFEFERVGAHTTFLPAQLFDTMTETRDFCKLPGRRGGYKVPKLEELHSILFGESFDNAHDAMGDVRACARCAQELIRRGMFVPEEPQAETSAQASLF